MHVSEGAILEMTHLVPILPRGHCDCPAIAQDVSKNVSKKIGFLKEFSRYSGIDG
jgi:hypothetical protein